MKKTPPSKDHRFLSFQRLLLLSTTLLIGFGVAEWLCRLNFKKNIETLSLSQSDLYYYYDPNGIRRHMPNKTGYERLWDNTGKVPIRLNSFGFRGDEITTPKPPGRLRILFIGDSITLGGRLWEKDTFVYKVGEKLKRRIPNIDVVNAGVGDIGLTEEWDILISQGLTVEPDLVVLCWYLNDGRPPVGFPEEKIYKNRLIQWLSNGTLMQKSYFVRFCYDSLRSFLLARQINTMETVSQRFRWAEAYNHGAWAVQPNQFQELIHLAEFDWGDAWKKESLDKMFGQIRSMSQRCRSKNIPFVVVATPVHAQVYANLHSPSLVFWPQEKMRLFCENERIPFVDLIPALNKRRSDRLFYDQCHYTPLGNEVVAEEMTRFIEASGTKKSDQQPIW